MSTFLHWYIQPEPQLERLYTYVVRDEADVQHAHAPNPPEADFSGGATYDGPPQSASHLHLAVVSHRADVKGETIAASVSADHIRPGPTQPAIDLHAYARVAQR